MSKKAWIIFATVCVALLAGLVYTSSKDKINVTDIDANKVQPKSEQSGGIADHVFGKADSKVVLIEYGDFQCPGCASAHPKIKEVTEKYKDQVAFVFRNFPIASIHPNARAAAAAAEAAGLQGKYWEMFDKLYTEQQSWQNLAANERTDFFTGYATDLGLDAKTFKDDMASPAVTKKTNFDLALGKQANVTATPTFFLNGEKATDIQNEQGGIDEKKLDAALAAALKKQGIPLPKPANN